MKSMLTEFPWNERYRISNLDDVLSPALVLYPEIIASNIDRTVQLLGGKRVAVAGKAAALVGPSAHIA